MVQRPHLTNLSILKETSHDEEEGEDDDNEEEEKDGDDEEEQRQGGDSQTEAGEKYSRKQEDYVRLIKVKRNQNGKTVFKQMSKVLSFFKSLNRCRNFSPFFFQVHETANVKELN